MNGLCYTTECEKIGVLSVGCVNNHVALLECIQSALNTRVASKIAALRKAN